MSSLIKKPDYKSSELAIERRGRNKQVVFLSLVTLVETELYG